MVTAILVAAGTGSRMGTQTVPKQFLCVCGVPILGHTLKKFSDSAPVDQIILVVRDEDRVLCENIIKENGIKKIAAIVKGGKERQDSVFHGLQHAHPHTDVVLIHDAVRMFVTEKIITRSIRDARQYGASVTAVPVKDTIKQVGTIPIERSEPKVQRILAHDGDLFVVKTLERNALWQVQTPQAFQYHLIYAFHQKALELGIHGTDDAMLAEHFRHPVKIVPGSYRNIKITTPDDLLIAQAFLQDERRIKNGK
jgi:2-C-methyl-D-erythritol 4-phosphate cytidylyltransferase